jgi:hypothetical protein
MDLVSEFIGLTEAGQEELDATNILRKAINTWDFI